MQDTVLAFLTEFSLSDKFIFNPQRTFINVFVDSRAWFRFNYAIIIFQKPVNFWIAKTKTDVMYSTTWNKV